MADDTQQPQFALQRIYIKDLSFESPKAPDVFQTQWQPEVKLDLNTHHRALEASMYEVVLALTVTAENPTEAGESTTAFVVEVQQAGLFMVAGLEKDDLHRTLGAFCPNILFPYAREAVDNLVLRGSFPPVMLAPVNFEALYLQAHQQAEQDAEQSAASNVPT